MTANQIATYGAIALAGVALLYVLGKPGSGTGQAAAQPADRSRNLELSNYLGAWGQQYQQSGTAASLLPAPVQPVINPFGF